MKSYKIKFLKKATQDKLKKLQAYGSMKYLGNFEYAIEVEDTTANLLITIHSRNGVIITPN